jgi:diguanylate cyclase (GGDEF)-like protein
VIVPTFPSDAELVGEGRVTTTDDAGTRPAAPARFRALADIARVARAPSREQLLVDVAEAARAALDGASASLSEWEPGHGLVRTLVNVGDLGPGEELLPQEETYSMLEYGMLTVMLEEERGILTSIGQDNQADAHLLLLHQLRKGSSVCAPIPLDGRVWGELFVTRALDQSPFTESELDFAVAVAAQVGAALATAQHLEQVSKMAYTDSLTGLANRRAVDDRLDAAMMRRVADGSTVGLVVCDLNGLKRINDESGHDAGDRALVRFAGLLSATAALLPGALAARLGGDEFCVVVDGVGADFVIEMAESLCRSVAKSPLEGVSCGVVVTGDEVGPIDSAERLFRLADAAQYRAKRSRSTRPVVAGRPLPDEALRGLGRHPLVPSSPRERRLIRQDDVSPSRLLDLAMVGLDEHRDASAVARLELVADVAGHHVDGLGWWLSIHEPGSHVVRTAAFTVFRAIAGTPETASASPVGSSYPLADYPLTARILDGGSVVVSVDDPEGDPGELALLDGLGAAAQLMVGVRDAEGRGWLLELYADALSRPLAEIASAVRALMVLAVSDAAH